MFSKKTVLHFESEANTTRSLWMYSILIPNLDYKSLEKFMEERQIQIRPCFYDLRVHDHLTCLDIKYKPLENAKDCIMLPSYPDLTVDEQNYIVTCIREYILLNNFFHSSSNK